MAGKELNATAAALLGLLHDGSMTGGQLMAEATRRLGPFWTMTRSQVYRELPALAEVGYVRVGKPGPRASVPYTISAAGKRAFSRWLNKESGIGQLRDPVALRTAFASQLTPSALSDLYKDALEQHTEALNDTKTRAKELAAEDAGAATAMDFAVGYHKSALTWLRARQKLVSQTGGAGSGAWRGPAPRTAAGGPHQYCRCSGLDATSPLHRRVQRR